METQNPPEENSTTKSDPRNEENNNILESTEDIRQKLYEKCIVIAESQDILSMLVESLDRSGLIGNQKASKLLYLAITSRLSHDPISVIIKGESSSGKSYTVDKVIEYFPPDAVEVITSMSDKALAYFDKPVKHRFLYFREAAGLTKNAEYLIRSIISEKRIDHYTVGSSGEGPELRRLFKEGPTGVIITTTKYQVHPENETRLMTIGIDSTQEHIRDLFQKQAEEYKLGAPLNKINAPEIEIWKIFNSWVAMGPVDVTIPYADTVFSQIPPVAARLSRDIKKLGELIKAHAVIHQQNRERTPDGKIIANLFDYEVVYELSAEWFAEGVELAVPDKVRKVVEAVKTLSQQGASNIRQSDIGKLMNMEKTDVSRAAKLALEKGFIKDLGFQRRGCSSQLVIGSIIMPENESLLPSPEKVKRQFEQASGNSAHANTAGIGHLLTDSRYRCNLTAAA